MSLMNRGEATRKNILITAGPTREYLDPVRYISNDSTGLMGYELAEESSRRGFNVQLVSGPVSLEAPRGIQVVNVKTSGEMAEAVLGRLDESDCLIMTAAVCDFKPVKAEKNKIKKREKLIVELTKTQDILKAAEEKKDIVKVGFALETEQGVDNGLKKLKDKNLDLIVINIKTPEKDPFGPGKKDFILATASGGVREIKDVTKKKMAGIIMDEVEGLL